MSGSAEARGDIPRAYFPGVGVILLLRCVAKEDHVRFQMAARNLVLLFVWGPGKSENRARVKLRDLPRRLSIQCLQPDIINVLVIRDGIDNGLPIRSELGGTGRP